MNNDDERGYGDESYDNKLNDAANDGLFTGDNFYNRQGIVFEESNYYTRPDGEIQKLNEIKAMINEKEAKDRENKLNKKQNIRDSSVNEEIIVTEEKTTNYDPYENKRTSIFRSEVSEYNQISEIEGGGDFKHIPKSLLKNAKV